MDHNVKFPDADKIKTHFQKNKKFYVGFGVGALLALSIRRPVKIAPVFNNVPMFVNDRDWVAQVLQTGHRPTA